ncbi:hypothetical protein CRYUN_Cryun29cG0065100 [Craigia yunnanensis]
METPTPIQHSEDNGELHIFRSKYPPVPVPDNFTLPEFVLQDAELYADKALRSLCLRKGHVVLVLLPNIAEYGIVALGIMAAGGVFSGANPASHPSEIKKQADAANAKLIVTNGPNYEKVRSTLKVPELGGAARSRGPRWGRQQDIPECIVHTGGDICPIVPPIILALVKNPIVEEFDLGKLKLRAIMTAAPPLAPELLSAFEKKFPGVEVQEAYGLTEHSRITLTLTHGDPINGHGIAKKSSVGFILPNLEIKFIDPDTGRSLPKNTPGELCVRSQCVMQGYCENKEETNRTIDKNGWLHTGDIAYIDDDGDIFIVDRIKELIKYKGFQDQNRSLEQKQPNATPAELEAILLSHPLVKDAAVVPLPDEEAGEIPAACVVMNPNAKESETDIMDYVTSNVAHYKKVRVLQFVDTIPKSSSGNIMRRLLKEKMIENTGKNSSTANATLPK